MVKETGGTVYKQAEAKLALINNGLMHLFDNIKYELSSIEVDSVYLPGQATTMFGLLTKNQNCVDGGGQIVAGFRMMVKGMHQIKITDGRLAENFCF